jgi:RimJ/RimL family protein N-acetyltransferase
MRAARNTPKNGRLLVEEAMRAAGEPNDLAAPRLAHGDEFFGWLVEGEVVSFGWVTYRDRTIGPVRLTEAPGRAFLYNFHTQDGYRGRGLYPALLLAMRCSLGREQVTELVIDVNLHNTASIRGIEKAGFVPVANITYFTIFSCWSFSLKQTVINRACPPPY